MVADADLLDFREDYVHVCEGDVLAIDDAAVFTQFGPVLAVHVFAGGSCVSVDGEAAEGLLQRGDLHRRFSSRSSVARAVGRGGQAFGCVIFWGFAVRPQGGTVGYGVFGGLNFKLLHVAGEEREC